MASSSSEESTTTGSTTTSGRCPCPTRRHWTQLRPTGPRPSPRAGHTVIYDPLGHRHDLVRRVRSQEAPGDRGATTCGRSRSRGRPAVAARAHLRHTARPRARATARSTTRHARAHAGLRWRERAGVPGRRSGRSPLDGGVPRWSLLEVEGAGPSPREEQAAVYDSLGDRLVISWGYDTNSLGDTWALSLDGDPAWAELPAPGAPQPFGSWGHGAVYDAAGDRAVAYGGTFLLYAAWTLDLAEAAQHGFAVTSRE